MKHTNLFNGQIANGLHTPPCGSSHGKSTRFLILTLLLGLLTLGSTSAWGADYYIAHGDGWNTNSNWGFNEGMTKVGDVYYYKLAGRAQNSKIQFKIRPSDDDSGWNKHLYQNANADTQNRGNITLLGEQEGSDTKKRFAYTPTTSGGEDIYIYTDGTSVWANAVKSGATELTANAYFIQGDLWGKNTSNNDWNKFISCPVLTFSPAKELAYTTFLIPVASNSTTVNARFELFSWDGSSYGSNDGYTTYSNTSSNLISSGTSFSVTGSGATGAISSNKLVVTIPGTGNAHTSAKLVRFEYTSNRINVNVSDAPAMAGTWYLYIDKEKKGTFDASGNLIVNDFPATASNDGFHSIFVANEDGLTGDTYNGTIKMRKTQGVVWLGGAYIDIQGCSSEGITWQRGTLGKNSNFSSYSSWSRISSDNSGDFRGGFKLSASGNTLFSLNNGVLTIKKQGDYTAPEPDPTPSGVTYTSDEYIYWHKSGGSLGWGSVWANNCNPYLQFSNDDETQTALATRVAFFWDSEGIGGDVLASQVPAGTWTKVRVKRYGTQGNDYGNNSDWVTLEANKNYIPQGGGTMGTYSPRTFHFYISGSTALANTGSEFNAWNGNGTAHSGSIEKQLNAGTEYKFKLNPTGTEDWRSEFNWNDVDATNSSNNINLRKGNNNEIWFDLAAKSNVTISCDGSKVTVVAVPVQQYTVTFDSNGGSAVASQSVDNGGTATEPSTPSRQGYTFQGWKLNDNTYNFSTAVTGNITLVADWSANPLPAGSFYVFGAGGTNWVTGWSSHIIEDYRMDVANGEATKTFYNVSGSGLEFKIRNFTDGVLNSNNKQDFTNAIVTPLAEDNSRLISRVWANGETNIDFSIKSGSSANVTVHFNGHEIWLTAVEVFTVTFDSEGGSVEASQLVTVGGNATRPVNNPNKDGYTFNFWKLSGESTAFDFENTTITSNITLVADWSEVPAVHYTVTFMDGLTELTALAQDVIEGNHASAPSEQSKDGYTFVEWRENGASTAFDFEQTAIGSNVTLYAIWEAKTMTGISLNEDALAMVIDNVTELTATFAPSDLIAGNQPTYAWSVLPAGVVTLSANNGTCSVTAVEEGNATITCTATAGNIERSATCTVSVQACNLVATDIFSYTLGSDPTGDAAGSAVMNGMFNEADNTEEETVKRAKISLKDNDGNNLAALVDDNGKVKADNSVDDGSEYWYMIPAGTKAGYDLFYLKNAVTKAYIYADQSTDYGQNGDWKYYAARTTETLNDADNFKWLKWINEGQGDKRYIIASAINFDANSNNGNIRGLYRTNVGAETWLDPYIKVGKQANNGYNHARNGMVPTMVEATVDNPAYMHSPVSGYYRFATGASVVATLNRAIKVNDVIRLEVKNPSEAAVSATVTIGSQVENINLAAGTTTTEEITVTDESRPTAITIASDDANFMLKSVVVNREMPNPGRNPNLAWSATPSAAHQVADGDISSYIATRSGAGLITYTSSDESIATVAADGTVHPIAEGTVTITATLEQDGCYNGGSTNYSLTLNDLPKPTITLTVPDAAVPQGSVQTISASQNGDGEFTVSILSGSDATLTNNGDGTYTLRLGDNASNIVIEAATTRTLTYAQHAVTETVEVTNCAPDGRIIYSYTLSGHDDLNAAEAEGGTYSQANLASVGTDDNPKTVELIKIKFQNDQNRIIVDDNGVVKYVTSTPEGNIEKWYKIPAGTNSYNNALYYLKNKGTDKYLYCDMASGYVGTQNGWNIYAPKTASALPSATLSTGNTREAYKWFWYPHNGTENNNLHLTVNQGYQNSHATRFVLHDKYDVAGNNLLSPYVRCGQGTNQGNSELRVVNEVVNANANNPDYFYSVENDNHTYYILNGGTVTVSRASAFKAGDVITLNVFNRGAAAANTIKVANNTIATNVNGAAALQYTVAEGDGIQGQNNFVITPLNGYICLSSISIFRPKDEDEFINPTLTWDDDLSAQQVIDMNNNETGMTHTVSVNAPVNAAVVYSVSPAAKADINSATGALTLTGEAQNKDVLTVTATLPAIGCYNEAHATYEIYVKNLAMPTLSASFSDGLKQGYAATLTVETNSDAEPVLSAATGFTYGDAEQAGNVYTYPIVIGGIAESVSVHVALAETADYLAYAIDAADVNVAVSNIADLYDNTPANGTLVLEADYAGELIVDKAITINGNGHSIGNLTVQTAGDLTLSGALTVNNFSIYAQAGNSTNHATSGQVRNATNLIANGDAYFYYTIEPGEHVQHGWYDFTVPFPVNTASGIKGIQDAVLNDDFAYGTDYAILEHLGDKQAAGEYAYKKFQGVMTPCRLYSITLDDDYNYKTLRFQKTNDGALVAADAVTLNAYEGGDAGKANWNGVGNGTLHHANVGVTTEVIQVYQSGNNSFMAVTASSTSLAIGTAFMVQEAGTMTLGQASHALLAPRRAASVQPTAIQIASEGQPFSDQLFISADEMAGQVYTQGADVAKAGNIGNVNVPQIWTNAYNSKLCAHEAQLINGEAQYALSLYAPANGSYTLTSKNIPEGYTLYLTQNGNRIWDLSESYVLDLTKGTATEYGLLLVENYKMPTAVENIGSQADETQKIMHNGILYILRNGKVFNAQGARVE